MPIEELIAQILAGNKDVFADIVREYQGLLYSIAYAVLHDAGEAENVTQEAFIQAYLSLDRFQGQQFKSWICRIATNKAIDYKRRQTARRQTLTDFSQEEGFAVRDTMAADIERRDETRRLLCIIEELPPTYGRVVRLRHIEGLSLEEICDITGQKPKTVESQLYRAKQKIRQKWGDRIESSLRSG